PTDLEAYTSLASVYQRQNQPARAKECYDKLVASAPEAARVYLRRAEYRRDRGDFAGALADCATAGRKEPGSALPALVQASVEAARGRDREAVAQAEQALKKAPLHDGRALYAAA